MSELSVLDLPALGLPTRPIRGSRGILIRVYEGYRGREVEKKRRGINGAREMSPSSKGSTWLASLALQLKISAPLPITIRRKEKEGQVEDPDQHSSS